MPVRRASRVPLSKGGAAGTGVADAAGGGEILRIVSVGVLGGAAAVGGGGAVGAEVGRSIRIAGAVAAGRGVAVGGGGGGTGVAVGLTCATRIAWSLCTS